MTPGIASRRVVSVSALTFPVGPPPCRYQRRTSRSIDRDARERSRHLSQGAVVVQGPRRRGERHEPIGAIDDVHVAVGPEVSEVVDLAPDPEGPTFVLDGAVGAQELVGRRLNREDEVERVARRRDDGPARHAERLARRARRATEQLALDDLGMDGADARLLCVRRDRGRLERLEDRQVAGRTGTSRGDARPARDVDRATAAAFALEAHVNEGRGGRLHAHADELEELDVELVRHLVEPVDRRVGEEGENLDQGHPRIAGRQVRPRRSGLADALAGRADELVEASVVELG